MAKQLLKDGTQQLQRSGCMSISEIMTIAVSFQMLHNRICYRFENLNIVIFFMYLTFIKRLIYLVSYLVRPIYRGHA